MVPTTTVVLIRHGATAHTAEKRFSGGLAGANPPLAAEGVAQAESVARWLAPVADRVDALVSSPVRRARETADVLAGTLSLPVREDPAFAELEFGRWEGLTFAEVQARHPEELSSWLGSMDVAPPGGESIRQVRQRVLDGLDEVVGQHRGGTVVLVTHVTPIKMLVAHALGAPLEAIYRMELAPASVTVLGVFGETRDQGRSGSASLQLFNGGPEAAPLRPR